MSGGSLIDISAISAMIGYCQSLKAGTVITSEYIECMNSYYVPKLQEVADRIKPSQAPVDVNRLHIALEALRYYAAHADRPHANFSGLETAAVCTCGERCLHDNGAVAIQALKQCEITDHYKSVLIATNSAESTDSESVELTPEQWHTALSGKPYPTNPVQAMGGAGSDDPRTNNASSNNTLGMPAGSNPRTLPDTKEQPDECMRACPKCRSEVIGEGIYDANMDGNPVKFQECMKCDYTTLSASPDDCRAAFHNWWPDLKKTNAVGRYTYQATENAWQAWQAAWGHRPPERELVSLDTGARACARWRNGKRLSASAFDEMREGEKNAYLQQAQDCAEAWGLQWRRS